MLLRGSRDWGSSAYLLLKMPLSILPISSSRPPHRPVRPQPLYRSTLRRARRSDTTSNLDRRSDGTAAVYSVARAALAPENATSACLATGGLRRTMLARARRGREAARRRRRRRGHAAS